MKFENTSKRTGRRQRDGRLDFEALINLNAIMTCIVKRVVNASYLLHIIVPEQNSES